MPPQACLKIDVARLDREGEQFTGEIAAAALDLGSGEGFVEPASDVAYDLRVERIGSELLVRGSAAMEVDCVCSRCAEPFRVRVAEPGIVTSYPLAGEPDFVDLTPELREAMILVFPRYPVCRETCRGLCPRCGANLNRAACRCTAHDADDRWGALDALAAGRKKRAGGAAAGRRAGKGAGNKTNT